MMTRALSGTVYVALIVGCTLGGRGWFTALMTLFAILGVAELEKLLDTRVKFSRSVLILDAILAVAVIMATGETGIGSLNTWIVPIATICAIMWFPLRLVMAVMSKSDTSARDFAVSAFAVIYVVVPLAMMTFSRMLLAGSFIVMATFIMLWLNDTGAYLTGRSFGRRKLCERLSPKKTWEGFWGGFALCVIAGCVTGWLFSPTAEAIICFAVYGAAVSVLGTFGDLFESLIKRTLGVKDSGNIIPGHGGILDRIDSLLGVAPLTFLFCCIINVL